MRKKPKLTNIHTVAQSRIFNLESLDVEFSNGATRVYERLMSRGNGAVLVIPMLDDDTVRKEEEWFKHPTETIQ